MSEKDSPLYEVRELLRQERPVRAHDVVMSLLTEGVLSPSETTMAVQLMTKADRQIERLQMNDPVAFSLQKASAALDGGDLRTCMRYAQGVIEDARSHEAQLIEAQSVLSMAQARRDAFAPGVEAMLTRAKQEFESGRFAEAKRGVELVYRSGVRLTAAEQRVVDSYRAQLLEMEIVKGDSIEDQEPSLGVLQPGVARPRDEGGEEQPAEIDLIDEQPEEQPEQPPQAQPGEDEDVVRMAMRGDAAALMSQADAAFEERRLNTAIERYQQVIDEFGAVLTEQQRSHAEQRLGEARVLARQQQPGLIEPEIDRIKLNQDQVRAEFNNELRQARDALGSGDVGASRDHVNIAEFRLKGGRNWFAESQYEQMLSQSQSLRQQIERAAEDIRRRQQQLVDEQVARDARASEQARERQRAAKINELIDRARAYQKELRYAEALQTINELLFIDPINPSGLLLRDVITDIMVYDGYRNVHRRKENAHATLTIQNYEAVIPSADIIGFPSDWPRLSISRGSASGFTDTSQNRAVLAQMEKQVPAQFTDAPLEAAVDFVGTLANIVVDVDWDSLADVGIDRQTPVTLNLPNATVRTVMDRMMEKVSEDEFSKADWAVKDGILTVASDEKLRKDTHIHIYDISDLLIDVPDYTEVPDLDLQSVLQSNQGGGGQSPFRDDQNQDIERRTLEEKRDEVSDLIQQLVDFDGWRDNGGDTGTVYSMERSLIITNTAKNHQQIQGLLSKLRDVRAMQINVETRFLLVNQDWFEQIGFDLDLVINANNNQFRAAQATDPTLQPRDFFDFSGQSPTGNGLQRSVTGARFDTAGNDAPVTQGVVNPRPWSPIGFLQNSFGLASALTPTQGIAADVLSVAPALGIAGQFLDDIQVDFLIQATQADRRSVQLTAPRLTFTNGQTANIFVATQVSFVSDLTPVVGDSAVGFDPDVNVVSEGVTLLVEGTISADRRYVTLNVDAGVARIDGFAQTAVTAVAGGQLVNSADTSSFIQLPQVTVTRVRTTVTVPDQGTILLGGQRLITEFDVETGVPVLSKIPVLNRFFTNRIESKEEQTLLILLKPTVLIQNEQEQRNFPGLLDSIQSGLTN
jgi:type II secretory pathway component GspD/PulD (secretin)